MRHNARKIIASNKTGSNLGLKIALASIKFLIGGDNA
jgi:hypothetical protein